MHITLLENRAKILDVRIITWVWLDPLPIRFSNVFLDTEVCNKINNCVTDAPVQTNFSQSHFEKMVWGTGFFWAKIS